MRAMRIPSQHHQGKTCLSKTRTGRKYACHVQHYIILFIVLTLFCALAGCSKKPQAPPPPVVEVMTVIQKDVSVHHEWIGTLDGMVNATIRAQVQGYLISQNYREGDFVKKGQILFEIDPRSFQATLEKAKGQFEAQQARWTTAKANLARVRPLAEQNAISKKDLDDSIGTEQAAQAAVLSAQATVDNAKLNLDFTRILSPVDGIAGIAKAQIGNLVGPGGLEELTTVSTIQPIKVFIQVSEQEYLQSLRKTESERSVEQRLGKLAVELILADGTVYPHKGTFLFADRQVDVKTGTIKLACAFPNPGNFLRPGQYGRIRVATSVLKDAVLVPQRAVGEIQGKYMVAVIGPDNKADIRPVKTGDRVDSLWVILEGLKPGEQVVVEGIQKVRPGMTVAPKTVTEESIKSEAKPEAKAEATAPATKKSAEPAKAEKR